MLRGSFAKGYLLAVVVLLIALVLVVLVALVLIVLITFVLIVLQDKCLLLPLRAQR